jgi:hypothetical protein
MFRVLRLFAVENGSRLLCMPLSRASNPFLTPTFEQSDTAESKEIKVYVDQYLSLFFFFKRYSRVKEYSSWRVSNVVWRGEVHKSKIVWRETGT